MTGRAITGQRGFNKAIAVLNGVRRAIVSQNGGRRAIVAQIDWSLSADVDFRVLFLHKLIVDFPRSTTTLAILP